MKDRSRRSVHHVVGLDYGTHSTKCVIRVHGSSKAYLLGFANPELNSDYAWFTDPSLVRVAGNRLYFGRKALAIGEGTLFRSLKMQLLPPGEHSDPQYPEFPSGTSPDCLIACYLSRILRIVRRTIERESALTRLTLNIGAPMDHFEDENEVLKQRYLEIANAAWHSVFGASPLDVRSGVALDDVRGYFFQLLQREVEQPTVRPFDILPETVAPIVSMSTDPRMEAGFYLIMDMGAGTTEFSVNLVNEGGADHKVVCYFDRTRRIGGDDFQYIEQQCAESPLRQKRIDKLINDATKGLRETCFGGFKKDQRNKVMRPKWKQMHLLLAGGAARRQAVEEAVRKLLPICPHVPGESCFTTSWQEPDLGGEIPNVTRQQSSLLAVANGLSFHRRTWPMVFKPDSVEHIQSDEIVVEKPEAYWYI